MIFVNKIVLQNLLKIKEHFYTYYTYFWWYRKFDMESWFAVFFCSIERSMKTKNANVSIFSFFSEHFPYFKNAPSGWKNSVRHNLSLNKCFEKIEKPASNGSQRKGCLWAMNPNKIQKMNEEVQKWSRKDPMAIKKGMACPGKNLYTSFSNHWPSLLCPWF